MDIKSISDIPAWIFYPIKLWADKDSDNFNILVGTGMILLVRSFIMVWILVRRLGESDERTSGIYLKAMSNALVVLIVCEIIFPSTYLVNQFKLYKYAFAMIAAAIYLFSKYRKEMR
ncbi:hypothetical protein [Lentilactobacillus kisonensis]|uniref:DUF2178 domain-containing protein n=1 Tax=Lentilactobacillus kisonensis DSM 19906 = JCM 15041 TaxID=1423766 RepID=A0A0R1NXS2_9LACO|nr:hypothetical protein [Lentilactobacillus kisonensis]KRL23156.1 hypothetical protein FC98_GL001197 [Lentilactobacillus kisonensis DSM 19906 = JCM 15041]